jgi:Zn-dependent protease with chaperone function
MWLSPSLPLAILFVGLLFGSLHTALADALARKGEDPAGAIAVVVAAAVGYLLVALYRLAPIGGVVVNATASNPAHRQLLDVLADVCRRAGVRAPWMVLRVDSSPNVTSYGLCPGICCLYVNQGLLSALADSQAGTLRRDELSAVLAHEIAHLTRFDTLLFCLLRPPLWVANCALRIIQAVFSGLRKAAGSTGMLSLLLPFVLLFGGRAAGCGLFGCLTTLVVLTVLVALAGVLVSYGLAAMVVLLVLCLGVMALCQLYSQYAEKQADLQAAKIIGDGDAVLWALAHTSKACPSEAAVVRQFAAAHLGVTTGFSIVDVIRCLKNGGNPSVGVSLRQRLFRSHPLLTERFAFIIRELGTKVV